MTGFPGAIYDGQGASLDPTVNQRWVSALISATRR